MNKLSVIGAGSWGSALAIKASVNNDVMIYSRSKEIADEINTKNSNKTYLDVELPVNIKSSSNLNEVLDFSDVILLVIPAQSLRDLYNNIRNFNLKNKIFVICSKGIEKTSQKLTSDVFKEFFDNEVAILSGPNFADEVAKGLPAASTIASDNIETSKKISSILSSSSFRVYPFDDLVGIQVAGASKNVLAIACGITIGKELGENAVAALITRALSEISKLIKSFGGKDETILTLSAIGDIILTCSSLKSRNTQFGYRLARGENKLGDLTEGVATSKAIYDYAVKQNLDLPILTTTAKILNNEISIDQAIFELLQRPVKLEY